MNRDRFPGVDADWARLDGPAGTQMVDARKAVAVHPKASSRTSRSRA